VAYLALRPRVGSTARSGGSGPIGDDQIGQGEEHLMLGAVLLDAPLAPLAVMAVVFDEEEDRLDPATDLALEPLDRVFDRAHARLECPFVLLLFLAAPAGDVPHDLNVLQYLTLGGTSVPLSAMTVSSPPYKGFTVSVMSATLAAVVMLGTKLESASTSMCALAPN
jgi:hypothetical protein